MKKLFRKVQFLSNIATIVIALVLSFMAVDSYLTPNEEKVVSPNETAKVAEKNAQPNNTAKINPVGKPVPLQDVDWKKNKKTLVMYISTKCRYCTESGDFYKKLVDEHSSKNVNFVAVLPQSLDEGKQYLDKLGININEVYSSQLRTIGVSATPTLLLVNEDGVVSEMWRGKLSPDKEQQLLKRLFG